MTTQQIYDPLLRKFDIIRGYNEIMLEHYNNAISHFKDATCPVGLLAVYFNSKNNELEKKALNNITKMEGI